MRVVRETLSGHSETSVMCIADSYLCGNGVEWSRFYAPPDKKVSVLP